MTLIHFQSPIKIVNIIFFSDVCILSNYLVMKPARMPYTILLYSRGPGLDTEVSRVGFSLPWILLNCIIFQISNTNHGGATLDSEPLPTSIQFLYILWSSAITPRWSVKQWIKCLYEDKVISIVWLYLCLDPPLLFLCSTGDNLHFHNSVQIFVHIQKTRADLDIKTYVWREF